MAEQRGDGRGRVPPARRRLLRSLIRAHHGLSEAESHTLNARLVLILANHIGDFAVLQEVLALARRSLERG